jgi:Divergent InlB B-repeat domain
MILKLVSVFAAVASVAACLVLPSGARAVAVDRVTLTVHSRSIDGSLLFSDATGWSWRCVISGYYRCSVHPERGRSVTVTAERGRSSSWFAWDAGPCASSGPTCTLQVNDTEVSVTAIFSARLFLTTFGPGSISREKYPNDGTPLRRRLCSGWTGSDYCADYAYGERIRLRASQAQGSDARMTGWGGTCSGKPSTSTCTITMNSTRVASATFEKPPPPQPSDCPPNASCGGITATWRFDVRIWGAGTVLAPKIGNIGARTCYAYSAAGFLCSDFAGPRIGLTELKAIAAYGGRFLGWSGPCSGTGSCWFKTRSTPVRINARFG